MEHSTNSKILFRSLVASITLDETREEIEGIVFMLLYGRKGLSRAEVLTGKDVECVVEDFSNDVRRINAHEPVQYILGKAEFYGRTFLVNRSVLIPRPETELLVDEALIALAGKPRGARVLDVGTGSGCIAVTLALESPGSVVTGIDISEEALNVARRNADDLKARTTFIKHNLLGPAGMPGEWDVIVSNPPYVTQSEAAQVKRNVKDFEPHLALFVPDDNPLLFYKAIAAMGLSVLNANGIILLEINERMGNDTCKLFTSHGFNASIVKDLAGKDRIVAARRA